MINSILEIIGNTPLVRLENFEHKNELHTKIYAKLEYMNPFGSIKDRAALQIIKDAENQIGNNTFELIEATSGNMGIALSAIGLMKGYKTTIIMPENASEMRKKVIRSYEADLILTPQNLGMRGSIEIAHQIQNSGTNVFFANQFENVSSIKAHYLTTAPEIFLQSNREVDAIVCGIGSGGTIMGIAKYFKEFSCKTKIIGVLPCKQPHRIQGIGAGFKPKILDLDLIDEIICVDDEEAIVSQHTLVKTEGIFVGPSSGAVISAAQKISYNAEYHNKKIVLIFADSGERYI